MERWYFKLPTSLLNEFHCPVTLVGNLTIVILHIIAIGYFPCCCFGIQVIRELQGVTCIVNLLLFLASSYLCQWSVLYSKMPAG